MIMDKFIELTAKSDNNKKLLINTSNIIYIYATNDSTFILLRDSKSYHVIENYEDIKNRLEVL